MLRLLLVNANGADSTYGGAERYVAKLVDGLEARGHEVALMSAFPVRDESAARTISLHQDDWRDSELRRYRNHVGDWMAVSWRRFESILRDARPDLIHTNNLPGISTGIWERARRLEIPVVHTLHDYYLLCPRTSLTRRNGAPCQPGPLFCGLRTRRLARWAPAVTAVIGVSEHVLRRHDAFFPAQTPRIVIRPPLVPVDGRRSSPADALRSLGYLGVLTRNKGVEVLLEAAPGLAESGITLRIAGDGPLRAEVQATEYVQYEGRLEGQDLSRFLKSCDAGVIPSLWEEPGPFVLCEWLAAGRPVLATRHGGLGEAGVRGGVIHFDETAEALLGAVSSLQSPEAWQRLLESVPHVEDETDLERWITQHEDAYLASHRAASPAPAS